MKKQLLLAVTFAFFFFQSQSQVTNFWNFHKSDPGKIITDKGVARTSFPKVFKLYDLNFNPLRQELFTIVNDSKGKHSTIISLPNADGQIEQFEVNEASNFEADLQAKFPEIRAFSGKGITDKYATLKLSISPQGIQTMVFRTDKENEFIEPYSEDHTVYAVFKSQRDKNNLAWTCSTEDKKLALAVSSKTTNEKKSSTGELKTMRLALSCTAEYAVYFGATSATQVANVLTAFNNTLTRCNGVYEKDLGVHLNLVASTTNVIYYNATTDPYSPGTATGINSWNTQLQNTLSQKLTGANNLLANNAAYDIGHLFGKTGGGGNAGCIGCVCVDDTASLTDKNKGSGITSPADGIPQGDNFDIDYVVHEMGHQMGATHTFSNSNEGSGTNKEVGSGVTIMGYAGITSEDVAAHSIDIYHETSIEQIQANLATKTCPITTPLTENATPVIAPINNFTIPISTPFVLTGSATDANATDALTYCWEQNDDGGTSTGANSSAAVTKTIGPNFISWSPSASPSRYFPKLTTILANSNTTSQVGGDAGMLSEALSSVARTLNFRLTVRDNAPYSATAPIKVGQTSYTDMAVTVTAAAGPFLVSAPDTAVSWAVGTNQTVSWAVAGTDANGVNSPFVDIFLSTDGGLTYPIQLASKVPNNGSANITIPNNVGTTNKIMVKGYKHIFFDISNANFAITAPTSSFSIAYNGVDGEQNKQICQGGTSTYIIPYAIYGGFSGTTSLSVSGLPAEVSASFSPSSIVSNGNVTMTVTTTGAVAPGLIPIQVVATSGSTSNAVFYLQVFNSNFGTQTLTSPANLETAINPLMSTLTWTANASAISYDVQVATDAAFTNIIRTATVSTNSYSVSGLTAASDYYWRVLPKNPICVGTFSAGYKFTTGQLTCASSASTNIPVTIPATVATVTSTINVPSGVTISNVSVNVNITHTWINDLSLKLTSPAGTTITLVANPCNANASINDINATFDDAGTTFVCGNLPGISGTVIPTQPFSTFVGQSSTGTWTLSVVDGFNQDGGALNSWSLNVCSMASPLSLVQNQFQNFTLYPNPNKGNFTVQFNSNSTNDVSILVHDISGRSIFEKKYTNIGLFSQNLQLDNVQSGVYLVTVQDGDTKVVKRIIIQ